MDSTIPKSARDWLYDYSDALLGAGLGAIRGATGQAETEPDTKTVRQQSAMDWKRLAMIAGAVLAAAVALRFILKR